MEDAERLSGYNARCCGEPLPARCVLLQAVFLALPYIARIFWQLNRHDPAFRFFPFGLVWAGRLVSFSASFCRFEHDFFPARLNKFSGGCHPLLSGENSAPGSLSDYHGGSIVF
jgi:hypothetical protein